MKEFLESVLALGGTGYLNFWLSSRIRTMDYGDASERKYIIALMTSVNYSIYLFLGQWDFAREWRLAITVILALVFSLTFPFALRLVYSGINYLRGKKKSSLVPVKVRDMMFQDEKNHYFIFDLSGKLLGKGFLTAINGKAEEFSCIVVPYFESHPEYAIETEQDLHHYLEIKNLEARVYLNFEKNLKIIYF